MYLEKQNECVRINLRCIMLVVEAQRHKCVEVNIRNNHKGDDVARVQRTMPPSQIGCITANKKKYKK